jgi:flagellar biosynthesis component FlhA
MQTCGSPSRARYTSGCRCQQCKAANARSISDLRKKKLKGTLILGAIISAKEAKQRLDALHREQFTQKRLAHELGLRSPQVKVHDRITVRKHLRIQRVYRAYMSDDGHPHI